ncbi:hypothetical protein GCM10025868_00500 [Angustibacter aerolatus]|uniref:Proteasome ATPase n=1 Tax=Angustibacter aerolatus TaxID=1162965 RepID=A0ABQ6JC69_9ACTN|nr:hypothetical protein GCM10025868_00500 [Angustibacter aerolatus]
MAGRRRLQEALESTAAQNERLVRTLREARDQIVTLKSEVDRLAQPPSGFGTIVEVLGEGTVDVLTGGRKMRVAVSPAVPAEQVTPGREVLLNEALNVVEALAFERVGEVVSLKEHLGEDRVLVVGHADEERVARLADSLHDQKPARRRRPAARPPRRLRLRAHPEGRGRGARARGGARHRLRGHRRPRRPDRPDPRRRRACRTCTPTCSASTGCARRRACCSTARPAAARRSSPRRSRPRWRARWPSAPGSRWASRSS